jgi:hypothetical protein
MATTTTNYGFDVPTSSDLVKNGATAISTLGQDIDTFLAGSPVYTSGKNFVINGNANIAQRGNSFAGLSTGETYTIDRFTARLNNLGTWTLSQDTDAPDGFKTSLKCLVTTADAVPDAADFGVLRYKMEGQALQSLMKGSASAKTTTLSFWVKSNIVGNFVANLNDINNTRSIRFLYSTTAANTWEKKTITFVGDVTGGTIPNNSSAGMWIEWWLGSGSNNSSGTLNTSWAATVSANQAVGQTNVAAAVNNYFMITGVQWEIGATATAFQLATGTIQGELAACQRYYYLHASGNGQSIGNGSYYVSTEVDGVIHLPVPMRTAPTIDQVVGTDYYHFFRNNASDTFNSFTISYASPRAVNLYNGTQVSGTAGQAGIFVTANNLSYLGFSAEL